MKPKPDYGQDSYRGCGRLECRRALVTGGDSGIGRTVALAFAREGADVVIAHLPSEQSDAAEALDAMRTTGRIAIAVAGDLTDTDHCQALVSRAVEELGGLDILVNNAAYHLAHEGLEDLGAEEIEHTFRTNVFAMFHTCKAALEHLQPQARRLRPQPARGRSENASVADAAYPPPDWRIERRQRSYAPVARA